MNNKPIESQGYMADPVSSSRERIESSRTKRPLRLLDYAANVYSQSGEDGIIAKILELLPARDKWCVEFGAWDGRHLSNTCNLITHDGYSAVLIEANRKRFTDLVRNYKGNSKVITLNLFVGICATENLDTILAQTPIPKDFDFLSIDIEGNDYHVWEAMSLYTPKIVHIAFNPTIPTEVEFIQPADGRISQGASVLALMRLGRCKAYELVCVNHNSAIFVRSQYFALLGIANNDPRTLREDFASITYLFCGYDGTLFVRGREMLACHHRIRYKARLRQLPKLFRSYPGNFGRVRLLSFKVYRLVAELLGRA